MKDGDPVEVYPVWEDEYLKNIRIDQDYRKGIFLQSGGKLKGNYYIITPENCALLGDIVMKNSAGDDVHRFETKILDKQGKRLKELDGLAMLLVDVDYDGEIFDMDRAVFAKDIGEDGEINVAGLTDSVAVIAIDKHGNERKVYRVEG